MRDSNDVEQAAAVVDNLAVAGVVVCSSAVLAFAALQYAMPVGFRSGWGLNHVGVEHFRGEMFGGWSPRIDLPTFVLVFRMLLGMAWLGFAVAVGATLEGASPRPGPIIATIVVLCGFLTFLCPPSLSNDVYAYAAYARISVIHGFNPYVESPQFLVEVGDPVARAVSYLRIPSVYNGVWTLLSIATVALLRSADLFWQIVALKAIGGASVIGAALAGQKIADHFSPGRGHLTLLAIGLNPLFLIEGPGNGHNDLLMISLFLAALVFHLRGDGARGALLLGLSVGIKYVTIAALPWMILDRCRGRSPRKALRLATSTTVIALLPTVVACTPFVRSFDAASVLVARAMWAPGVQVGIELDRGLAARGFTRPIATLAMIPVKQWPVVVVFLGLSLWLWRCKVRSGWLDAWVVLAALLVLWTRGIWFPWYITWPWMVALTRWDQLRLGLSAMCLTCAIADTIAYSYSW